jgi:hypothetical protein
VPGKVVTDQRRGARHDDGFAHTNTDACRNDCRQVIQEDRRYTEKGIGGHGDDQDAASLKAIGEPAGQWGKQHHTQRWHGEDATLQQILIVRYVREVRHHLGKYRDEYDDAHHGEGDGQQQHDSLKWAGGTLGDRSLHAIPQFQAGPWTVLRRIWSLDRSC